MKDLDLHNEHTTILILKCWMSDSLSMDYGECSILVFFVNIFLHLNLNMVNFETEADIMLRSHSDINDAITNHSVCSRCRIPKSLLYKWCYNKLIVFSRYHNQKPVWYKQIMLSVLNVTPPRQYPINDAITNHAIKKKTAYINIKSISLIEMLL